jgi:hypothetical protein
LQFSSLIGGENGSDLTANVWQHLDAGRFESHLEFSRNGAANQDFHAYFNEVADNLVWLPLKEHDFLALQLGFAFQANEHQPRRHVKDWRHTALTVGYRNQHACRNARFVPVPAWLLNKPESPLKSGLGGVDGPGGGWVLCCKMQLVRGADYRNLRHCR